MTYSATQNFAEIWDISDEDVIKKVLLDKLDMYREQDTPWFNGLPKLGEMAHLTPKWGEQRVYGHSVVGTLSGSGTSLTITGNLRGNSISREELVQICNTGTILEYVTGGTVSQAKVSAIHASNPVLTVAAYGNTSMPADGASQTWTVLPAAWYDSRDADNPQFLDRTVVYTTTQIFSHMFQILKQRENLAMEWITDEVAHQFEMIMQQTNEEMAIAALRSRPSYSGGWQSGMDIADPTLRGLYWWCEYLFGSGGDWENSSIYVDNSGDSLDIEDINDMCLAMVGNGTRFNQGKWEGWCHPNTYAYMQDYGITYRDRSADDKSAGFNVNRINTKVDKEIPIYADTYFREDVFILQNTSNLGWGWFKNDSIGREELAKTGRYRSWQISGSMYGLVVREMGRSLGMIYNLTTS